MKKICLQYGVKYCKYTHELNFAFNILFLVQYSIIQQNKYFPFKKTQNAKLVTLLVFI